MRKTIIMGIIVAVVFGGGGYFLGTKFGSAKSQVPQGFAGRGNRTGGNLANGGFATGQIIAKDSSSITVQMGSATSTTGSKIIFYSATTPITKSVSGTAADLSVGEQITANGTANPDGSITANSIQIRPAGQARGN
jgi:hypothetical protein